MRDRQSYAKLEKAAMPAAWPAGSRERIEDNDNDK